MIKDLGLQFNFVAYEQVERSALSKYRVFILPFSMALSPEEAKAIREFAASGGIVIADASAGVMDDHCGWQRDGLLNDLFGIAAPSSQERRLAGSTVLEHNADGDITGERQAPGVIGPARVTAEGTRWALEETALGGIEAVETGVRADGGRALLRIGETDAVVVRQTGAGWAIYLNLLLDRYPEARSKGFGGTGYRNLVRALLNRLGIRPAVRVLTSDGKPLGQAQVVRYRFGESEALVVIKENVGLEGVAGRDGVTVYSDARLGNLLREEIMIELPGKRQVSNITTGEILGEREVVRTSILGGGALVLGLNAVQPAVSVAGPASGRRGEALRFAVKVTPSGRRIIRCHFHAPDGSFMPVYARNVLIEGSEGSVMFPSAHNDPAGDYRLQVTDVVSGAAASTGFSLR